MHMFIYNLILMLIQIIEHIHHGHMVTYNFWTFFSTKKNQILKLVYFHIGAIRHVQGGIYAYRECFKDAHKGIVMLTFL